jgi:peptidoglycan/xylan/chitin deacetylase (PgdA/CDA1 family)
MSPRLPPRVAARTIVVAALATLPLLVSASLGDVPEPVAVTIAGEPTLVPSGTSFGQAIRSAGLQARSGRLLDVDGQVLRHRADPGRILLDGERAPRDTPLRPGDEIEVLNGTDRTEGTERVETRLPGLQPGNPQYSLTTSKVVQVDVVGRISGKVVSTTFHSIGRPNTPPAIALTFDDGPWPRTTRQILRILERMHAPASFFLVGYLAERYPQMVRDEIDAGMTIGSHSWDHPEPFKDLKPNRVRAEMTQPSDFFRSRYGMNVTLFRPPGGSWDARVLEIARSLDMRLVQWNVDPRDWESGMSAREIASSVLSRVRPGSIVDLHDGGGDQSATVKALPRIIRGIRKMGLQLVAL